MSIVRSAPNRSPPEVMEIGDDGLIHRQRVYWGWFGVGVLQTDAYRR
jgi:hypothetical protein